MRDTRSPKPDEGETERSPGLDGAAADQTNPPRAKLGRYVLGERLGAGAMGAVYSAADPQLGRRVAIKLLHPRAGGTREATRLLTEARAMARLSHPNVITVHDVGVDGGRVYLAMEEVQGVTLKTWLASPRTTTAIVQTFVAAGRGLAAAHRGGLVHRDFKPDNVMVGDDGRVRVTDFGVAADDATSTPSLASESDPAAVLDERSRSGALVGTPAYMAPEQFLGSPPDARSDQFSFCVALFEALHGYRPYEGTTAGAVFLAMTANEIREPSTRPVPPWLQRTVVRGLAHEPSARFGSMHELMAALHRGQRPRRWAPRVVMVGLGLSAILVYRGVDDEGPDCDAGRHHLAGVWDGARAESVTEALTAQDTAIGREAAQRVTERLGRYTDRWVQMRDANCQDTQIRGVQSEADGDLRNVCLDTRLRALTQVLAVLETADPGVVRNAVATVAALPPLAECADLTRLRDTLPPAEQPAEVAAVRGELDRVRTLMQAGRFDASVALADTLQQRAALIDYVPLTAEVALARGEALSEAGRTADGAAALSSAYFAAAQVEHDAVAAGAAAQLAYVVGYRQAQHAQGWQWGEHALAAARRLDDGGLAQAQAHHNLAVVASARGDSATASVHNDRAYALRSERLDPDHPDLARSLNALGNVHFRRAEYDQALVRYREALVLRERVFGPSHPEVAGGLNNVAIVLMRRGEFTETIAALRRAVAIYASAWGDDNPDVAQASDNLGVALRRSGDPAAAAVEHDRALQIRTRTQGPEHPDTGDSLVGLGRAYSELSRHAEAVTMHRRALVVYERGFGPDHPAVGAALLGLGIAQLGVEQPEAAEATLRRAAAVFADAPQSTEAAEIDAVLEQIAARAARTP